VHCHTLRLALLLHIAVLPHITALPHTTAKLPKYHGLSQDFEGLKGILGDFAGSLGNSLDFKGF
jgi:hypothetical protein